MAIRLVVDIEGATRFRRRIDRLIQEAGPGAGRLQLMTRLGLTVLRWVDQNFASGGGKVGGWVPLRPLTVFGRRKGSAVPLSNTGLLKGSFTYAATEDEVAVGTARQVALWHQFGTAPYIIRPRTKKALAFPAPPGFGGGGLFVRRRQAKTPIVGIVSLQSLLAAGVKRKGLPKGKGQFQSFAVVREVHHPGLPARPMLPRTYADIAAEVTKTLQDWVDEAVRRALGST